MEAPHRRRSDALETVDRLAPVLVFTVIVAALALVEPGAALAALLLSPRLATLTRRR
jgi:hypothetical protein